VNSLEHEAVGLSLDVEDALHAEDVLTLGLKQFAQPRVELLGVQFPTLFDTHTGDGLVVGVVVTMAAMLMNMSGLDRLAVAFDASLELVQPMLGEEGVVTVGGNAQSGGDAVLAENEFVERLAGLDHSAHADGRSNAIEDSFGDFLGMVQCVVQPTPALLNVAVAVPVIMVMVMVMAVVMAVAVIVMSVVVTMLGMGSEL